jgi:hypothetical protein
MNCFILLIYKFKNFFFHLYEKNYSSGIPNNYLCISHKKIKNLFILKLFIILYHNHFFN